MKIQLTDEIKRLIDITNEFCDIHYPDHEDSEEEIKLKELGVYDEQGQINMDNCSEEIINYWEEKYY